MRRTKAAPEHGFAAAVTGALFLALCAYIGAALYLEAAPAPEPEAVLAPAAAGTALRGLAVRRERPVRGERAETLAADGKKVPAGGALARTEAGLLTAPAPALFFETVDGLERLDPAALEGLTVSGLLSLLEEEPEPEKDALGRLVLEYGWYFAALAEEDAPLPQPGPCRLRFAGREEALRGELLSVSEPEEGLRALVIRLTAGDPFYLSLRQTEALLLAETAG